MLSPGMVVAGRYRLEKRVAHGATGDLWHCVDEANSRTVAMKILAAILLKQPGFADQFQAEARAMASIDHPGVVVVYECVINQTTDPVAFLVTEFVEGESLARILARVGRLTPARTMSLVAQAADALHAGHEKGFVHGRVKPADIMIRPDDTVVLTSFGGAPSIEAAGLVVGGGHTSRRSRRSASQPPTWSTSTRWAWWRTSAWPGAGRSKGHVSYRSQVFRWERHQRAHLMRWSTLGSSTHAALAHTQELRGTGLRTHRT